MLPLLAPVPVGLHHSTAAASCFSFSFLAWNLLCRPLTENFPKEDFSERLCAALHALESALEGVEHGLDETEDE